MVISLYAKFTSCLLSFIDCPVGWKGQGEGSVVGSWEWYIWTCPFSSFFLPIWKYDGENSE